MTKSQNFLKRYILQGTTAQTTKQVAERVKAVVNDTSAKSTEVIRDGGFVHGRTSPVRRSHITT